MCLKRSSSPKVSSRLKCLRCGWKWWSRRRYIDQLPDHVERVQSGLTDEDVLQRIHDGTLIVLGSVVRSYNHRQKSWTPLKVLSRSPNGSTEYRFVTVCACGKKKKVALHRLVWMAYEKRVPPQGYDVHHVRHDVRHPDRYSNLRLVPSSINRSRQVSDDW